MSLQKVTPDSVETFTLKARPHRTFSSSSAGVTGSVYVFARRSPTEKETRALPSFVEASHDDANLDNMLQDLRAKSRGRLDIRNMVDRYMSGVHAQGESARKNSSLEIVRFTPTFTLTKDTQRKLAVKNILNPFYRNVHPKAHWAYTNYFSLNFFTASSVPADAVLIYPDDVDRRNLRVIDGVTQEFEPGNFVLPGEMSFDFYINPRYAQDAPRSEFKAGTILHLSSCYAVSLITGSSKDPNGISDGYRIQLQLSHSADVRPSLAVPGAFPNDLTFLSDDNSLTRNHWHHVVVRWGTKSINAGTGSFMIDGVNRGVFVVPSSTLAPLSGATNSEPTALFVGNYYEGTNFGSSSIGYYFAADPALRDGLREIIPDTGIDAPASATFRHQLNAEIHDLSVKRYYMTDRDLVASASTGPVRGNFHKIVFYLPPFFTKTSPFRQFVGDHGGVPQTPFFSIDGTTDDPFNVALSFGVGGHYMNLENFTRDFSTAQHPRLFNLSASEIDTTTNEADTANDFLYGYPATGLRNLMILPCDDGNFFPNYDMLDAIGHGQKYSDDLGISDFAWINLDNMISTASIKRSVQTDSGSFFEAVAGPTPEDPGVEPGVSFAILQRTQDPSSNQVVFFDISNLYYGNRIYPGSFRVTDTGLTSSRDRVSITLRDDGEGNLYRANSETAPATWSSVGNIYYNEGIVVVKDPSLFFFGQDQFEIEFKGEQNIHVMKFNVFLGANQFNSSSNPAFLPVSASSYPNDPDPNFVYVTGMNFHDENFNVVARTQLAQPILKRKGERYLVRTRLDW